MTKQFIEKFAAEAKEKLEKCGTRPIALTAPSAAARFSPFGNG
jgi:hypothetical protein